MSVVGMLKDVVGSLFKAPFTEQYPFVRNEAPERLRGKLIWSPEKCTGCGLCTKDCPANALEVIIVDRAKKEFIIHYNTSKCTYCGQCVESCRQGSYVMSNVEWELAALTKESFQVTYARPEVLEKFLAAQNQLPAAEAV
ncbi:MAG TPA: 4Fe-4S binding protein [Anaerolineales bacterium]|nr:4Fe-4S binding protein [Anaerolineales bacterium]